MSYIGNLPAKSKTSTSSQYFNGDGSTVAFTLNRAVNVAEDLEVFVNNIQQEPGVGKSYTATGTTLTFDAAPSSGTANVYVVYRGLAEVTTRLEHDANAALAATTGTFSGDLTVDTNTLYVDSTNNRVGIGNASPSSTLHIGTGYSTFQMGANDSTGFHWAKDTSALNLYTGANGAGTLRFGVDTSGRVTMPNQPYFLAKTSSSYYPASGSGILFSATNVITNRGSIYDSANSRFTAPVSGVYSLNYGVTWFPANNGSYLGSYFTVSSGGSYYFFNSPGSDVNNLVSADLYLAANDYVTFYTYSSNSSNGVSTTSYITGYLLG